MKNTVKKISSTTFTESDRAINNFSSNYVLVGNKRKFKDYEINNTGTIFATNLIETNDDFFNSTDVLNSIYGFGKQAHLIFKKDLINNLRKEKTSSKDNLNKDDEINFISFNELNSNVVLTNSFVDRFIPYDIFISHIKELKPLLLDFCQKNGMPYLQDDFGEVIDDVYSTPYTCNSRPFVSLSIIIYILFETQNNIKQIIENAYNKPTKGSSTLGYIFDSKKYGFNEDFEYIKKLKPTLWFFYQNENINFRELNIYSLLESVMNYCELIEKQTSYIKFTSLPKFFFSKNRFGIEEIHENLLSVAWSKLKLSMFGSNTKVCKNPICNNIFEPQYSHEEFCPECYSKNINKNVNSSNSYYRKQNLHKKLVELYNSTKKSKLNILDKNTVKQIEEYVSYNKASLIKNNTNIDTIQKYIDLLSNL